MNKNKLLGEYTPELTTFADVKEKLLSYKEGHFVKRWFQINLLLLKYIQEAPSESFLVAAVADFIQCVNESSILSKTFTFVQFEFWLNQFSGLNFDENYKIRAKIAGKYVPRSDYQAFFPIGMEKIFFGSHFVTAHLSPDVDTTIAAFFGWLDAFSARVGEGLHYFCVPGGDAASPAAQLLDTLFGKQFFLSLCRKAPTLTLNAMDLLTQDHLIKKRGNESLDTIERVSKREAVLLINEEGYYLGDWRLSDVEPIRQILVLFDTLLSWFENDLQSQWISLFAKEKLNFSEYKQSLEALFSSPLSHCEPVQEFNQKQKNSLDTFLKLVLHLPLGMESSFQSVIRTLKDLSLETFFFPHLFDKDGNLKEARPEIFKTMQKATSELHQAIIRMRTYTERLDLCLNIKNNVLKRHPHFLTQTAEMEDIQVKIAQKDYLTVVIPEDQGRLFPVGVIYAEDLEKPYLGTVSFRDFCNLEEVRMASYLTVISVVDHHKSSLKTEAAPLALIGDAQSCNVIVAEQAFLINDRYSIRGLTKTALSPSSLRVQQNILQRQIANAQRGSYFIHKEREFIEYLCFLHAILDDTDLLTKVSDRDVECVSEILNRMKTVVQGQEVEIISLDDIPKDACFAKKAARRIVQNEDMYSIYKKIYSKKQKGMEKMLKDCVSLGNAAFFEDTKIQNACCRIGQSKLFSSNFPYFLKHESVLKKFWMEKSERFSEEQKEIDLHLYMISTIPSAEEVFEQIEGSYAHQDELWFWIPEKESALIHLTSFLSLFQTDPKVQQNCIELQLSKECNQKIKEAFRQNFLEIPVKIQEELLIPAILKFNAGSINSRKALISPYLPRNL